MQDIFRQYFVKKLAGFSGRPEDEINRTISRPPNPAMGEYASSAPFLILTAISEQNANRPLGLQEAISAQNPKQIAGELSAKFQPDEFISSVEAVGGYVNARINRHKVIEISLQAAFAEKEKYGSSGMGNGKTVVLDFSSPNIAKPFGIGHLRSTVIGAALKRIYGFLGYKTVGINFLGDWGTQFGKLAVAFRKWGDEGKMGGSPVEYLNELYVKYHEESEKNPALEQEARAWFLRLEQGSKEEKQLWEHFKELSLKEFSRIYELLGVSFDSYAGESFFNDKMGPVIEELTRLGLTKESQGALIVDLEPYGMTPCLLKKADGATLYATRDITAAVWRHDNYQFDKLVYVVGSDQKLHFKQFFKVLELAGKAWAKNCYHVNFGLIRFKGEKMSTRRGKVVMLEDVLDRAVELTKEIVKDREMSAEKKEIIAKAVGTGAVIFNDLKNKRAKDVDFDWQTVLNYDSETKSFKGETGPYLQYTHTRLSSLLRNYDAAIDDKVDFGLLKEDLEFQIARELYRFPQVIEDAGEQFEPSLISNYLLELASKFSRYWHDVRIIGTDKELTKVRILLAFAVKTVMANGLCLLGIEPLEEM